LVFTFIKFDSRSSRSDDSKRVACLSDCSWLYKSSHLAFKRCDTGRKYGSNKLVDELRIIACVYT